MKNPEQIFIEAYERHADEIFRFIFFKLGNREKAKDLLQDVFMRTWIYMTRNGKIENIKAFLYKTSRNRVIDEYRRQGKKDGNLDSLETLSEESGYEPATDDVDALIDSIDAGQALELVNELPPIYSEVLFLRFAEDQSISEIAEVIGESNNAVSVRINRGLKKLKEIINEKEKRSL